MTVLVSPPMSDAGSSGDEPVDPSAGSPATMTRRSLLQRAGVGAATVVVAGIGVGSYRVFDNGVLNAGAGAPYDAWSHWRDDTTSMGTVAAAILAANPHNTQPWMFHVSPDSVQLFADHTRRAGTLDALDREHHIGLGCALENLVLAAAARGFVPTVTLLPDPADATHVATVDLTAGSATTSALHDAIGDRRSNRGPYTGTAISTEVTDSLGAVAAGLQGVDVRWFTSEADRAALGVLIVDATEAIIADEQQSKDSFVWFRNNRDDIDTHMDGLTLDVQGLGPVVLAMGKILPPTSRAAGDSFWLDQTRTVHTTTAAAYGVITVIDPDDPATQLIGGRLLQRIHLAATVQGLGLQHMNQITERIDREAELSQTATFAPRMSALLAQPDRQVLSTFRIGYPGRSARLSPRRPVSQVTR
jgi:hypothetical protein